MRTKIEQALELKFPPLAMFFAQQPPAEAKELRPLCSMLLIAQAAKGRTAVMTRGACGCPGAAEGFGLASPCPEDFPGGRECMLRFLSIGNKGFAHGQAMIQKLIEGKAPQIMIEEFSEGEGFKKTPELVAQWVEELPRVAAEGAYVVIKPLAELSGEEKPKVVVLLADPDQLSALVVLANFARPGVDGVRIPFSAGCASLALYPFSEAAREAPRAVIGLTDISARFYLRKLLGRDILSFTMPLSLFQEMEENAPESFLTRFAWKTMLAKK